MKTYIKGKDEALETSIANMQAKLQELGFDIEETLWLNPVSHIYSVNIRDKNCPLLFTNGKGSSREACLASALGEFFERLSCNYFFADFYLGRSIAESDFVHYPNERWFNPNHDEIPRGLLSEQLWRFYNPEGKLSLYDLIDTNSGNQERGICALPFINHESQTTVYFPVNIIGNLYVSNGMSAGNTVYEARTQALSEIFERYVKNRIIAEFISLPLVPEEIINQFNAIKMAKEELEQEGFIVQVRDASLGGEFPVMNVTMIEPGSGRCLASFGAHPNFEVALERTMTELLQGRRLDTLDGFHQPSFDNEAVADPVNLETHFIDSSGLISLDFFRNKPDYEFVYWDFEGDNHSQFDFLTKQIKKMGFDIYIADYIHLGIPACRIIVPGMSEVYPIEELSWQNNNEGLEFREFILNLNKLSAQQRDELLNRLEQTGFSEHYPISELLGIAVDADSAWDSLRLGELKAMLALSVKDYELALEWSQWCLEMEQLSDQRAKFYQTLIALLQLELDSSRNKEHFQIILQDLFGEQQVSLCAALIAGTQHFAGLSNAGLELEGFHLHQSLLNAYTKLQTAKLIAEF